MARCSLFYRFSNTFFCCIRLDLRWSTFRACFDFDIFCCCTKTTTLTQERYYYMSIVYTSSETVSVELFDVFYFYSFVCLGVRMSYFRLESQTTVTESTTTANSLFNVISQYSREMVKRSRKPNAVHS